MAEQRGQVVNEVTRGGLLLARALAPIYAAVPNVRAVMVGGSVAHGTADEYSDLEIGVFWDEPPSDEARKTAIARAGGALFSPQSFRPYTTAREWIASEHYEVREVVIDGMRFAGTSHIDAKHLTVSAMERCLDAVVIHYDIAPEKQRLIAAVQHGLPLYGATLLEHWQARAAAYPDELARRMVREYLWLGPWYPPEAYVAREDTLLLYQHFCWMAQALIGILAGLNRLYYPSSEYTSFQQTLPPIKWADRFIGEMHLTPRDLVARLKQIFSVAPPEGWRELCRLIEETLALVEAHLPQVNEVRPDDARPEVSTTWARERFVDRPYTLLRTIGADAQYRWPGHRCS